MSNYFKASGANRPAIVLAVVVLAFAAAAAWYAYDTSSRGGYILAVGLAIVAFLIPQAIMVADQWERSSVGQAVRNSRAWLVRDRAVCR